MPRFIALKDLPLGTKPGEEFEATEEEGRVLILVEAARPVDEPPPPQKKATQPPRSPRTTYNRKDIQAETPGPGSRTDETEQTDPAIQQPSE